MSDERHFPALDAWRRVSRHRRGDRLQGAPEGLIGLELDKNDIVWTRDPLHTAACCEADAREWLTLGRYFERRAEAGDDASAAACFTACDNLLGRSIDILAAAERAEGAADAA